MPVSMEEFRGQGWALSFFQGLTGAWLEGRMAGTVTAIPSTFSVCLMTPTGSSSRVPFLDPTEGTRDRAEGKFP